MGFNMIEGVIIKPLRKIPDERGTIMHMMKSDDPEFEKFGEIYFSTVYPGVIKGWHLHKEMTLNYAVVHGMIKLVLYDERDSSSTNGMIQEIFLGSDNYNLVKIPPMIWNGFKGMATTTAIVANLSTIPHSPNEIIRLDPFNERIPYNWELINR